MPKSEQTIENGENVQNTITFQLATVFYDTYFLVNFKDTPPPFFLPNSSLSLIFIKFRIKQNKKLFFQNDPINNRYDSKIIP